MNAQIIVFFAVIASQNCDEKVRIGLPEYVCDKDGKVRDLSNETITVQIAEGNGVSYKFDLKFHGTKCRNDQRCTLMVWRDVRELESYLKSHALQSGPLQLTNSLFKPGIQYFLTVTAMKAGRVLTRKQITVDYVSEEARQQVKKPLASLFLLGADYSYAHASYLVNADANICTNLTYHFRWSLLDDSGSATLLTHKGTELTVPPNTFQSPKIYTVKCELVNIADGNSVATAQKSVRIPRKELLLHLPVKRWITRPKQPIHIKAQEPQVTWQCFEVDSNEPCSTTDLEFETAGTYNISVQVSNETDWCVVDVVDDAPVVEIEDFDTPVNPNLGVEIRATIYDLRLFCSLQWTVAEEAGYEPLTLPGQLGQITNVTTRENYFLNELEEYTNGTIDMRYDLALTGLKGDVRYLFRLVITCPNDTEPFLTEPMINEVVVETNAPPAVQKLQVSPLEGEAFATKFKFRTEKASDKPGDGPVSYKFGYQQGIKVVLWNLGDVVDCEATLPYLPQGVQTFLECCDNLGSCQQVLGPLVKTSMPTMTGSQVVMQEFDTRMIRGDYTKAFGAAFGILQSFALDSAVRDLILGKIGDEIDKYLLAEDEDAAWKSSANVLLQNIKDLPQLQLSEKILNKMVDLRNKISEQSQRYIQRNLLSLRKKRSALSEIQNYLEVSEFVILTSSNPGKVSSEKENLRVQLRSYMEQLCSDVQKSSVKLELKTVIFSVEKLTKNMLINFIPVPFDGNSWQSVARVKLGNAVKDIKQKCVGKAVFKDYLGKTGLVYYLDVINNNDNADFGEVVVYLPKNKAWEGQFSCLVYRDGWHSNCKIVQNLTDYVKCSCKYLGYFYLEYRQVPVVQTSTPRASTATHENHAKKDNESVARIHEETTSKNNYDTVSYVVIVVSVVGIVILTVILRKAFYDDEDKEDTEPFEFPKYAQLHNEEYLNDAHI